MGNFANTLFSTLLGWLRGAAAWLWDLINNPDGGGLIIWIADNWLVLIVLLCAVCMLVDFVIYLIRWQPYKVWASFFRRVFGRGQDEEDSGRIRRRWIHADGTTSVEVVDAAEVTEEEVMVDPQPFALQPEAEAPTAPYNRFARSEAATAAPMNVEKEEPPELLERPARPGERRRRFTDAAEELPLRYAPPPAPKEDAPAYHEPYYPPQWKQPADASSSGVDVGGGL